MNRIEIDNVELQPLRIYAGWTVSYNAFSDIEPYSDIKVVGLPDEDVWELFTQDLLQIKYERRGILIDLGWTPEADPEGSYELTILENEDWDNPLYHYESKSKDDIVKKINYWLKKVSCEFGFSSLKAELN